MTNQSTAEEIRDAVRKTYAGAARQAQLQKAASCCSGSSCGCGSDAPLDQSRLYAVAQIQELPEKAVMASLGCGNPTLLAELKPGETVLDLGSGGGIDVLLSARRVGPTGKAYGLDMTDEMLELARANARDAQVSNVEFLKGQIESIPLPDVSVDVIISNCVINLSPDKDRVLAEAFRVLKPGGRFAVADIVVQGGPLPAPIQRQMALWAGCIAGALTEEEYRAKLAAAGFEGIDVEVLKAYSLDDVPEEMNGCIPPGLSLPDGTRIISGFIRATKGRAAARTEEPRIVKILGKSASSQARPASAGGCGSAAPSAAHQRGAAALGCCGSSGPGSCPPVPAPPAPTDPADAG